MGLNPKFSSPQSGAQFEKSRAPEADAPAPTGPILVAFSFYLEGKDYHAVAYKIQGDKVVEQKVLAVDDFKRIALDAVDRASFGLWNHGEDPFAARKVE